MTRKQQSQPGRAGDGALLKLLKTEFSKKSNTHQSVIFGFGYEPWQKTDAAWFRKHPRRSLRLRELHPGESPDGFPPGITHALVRQLQPGLRDKLFIFSTAKDSLPDDDAFLLALWMRLSDAAPGQPVPIKHAIADALRMGYTAGGLQ